MCIRVRATAHMQRKRIRIRLFALFELSSRKLFLLPSSRCTYVVVFVVHVVSLEVISGLMNGNGVLNVDRTTRSEWIPTYDPCQLFQVAFGIYIYIYVYQGGPLV